MIPALIIGVAIALLASFGGGWHFGSVDVAKENATLTEKLTAANTENLKLATSIKATKAECTAATAALQADVKRRSAAVKAAKKAGSDAQAVQRGTINGLRLQAITAADSDANCKRAADILDQLAKDRQP